MERVLGPLKERYEEVVAGVGVARATVYNIYVSRDGTFTFIATNARTGQTCVLGSGEGWEFIKPDFSELDPPT